jgi:2,4-dienoyl-CoA reductase-like NADH-dependent reductase (Old Yellow Enzyme family)
MPALFEQTRINHLTLDNRFIRSATWEARATPEGRCTDELVAFTVELAKGGVGLIVMGHAAVLPNGAGTPRQSAIYRDDMAEALGEIPPLVHRHGSRVALQLSHAGGHTRSDWIQGRIMAPSAFKNAYREAAEEMSPAQIGEVVQAFGAAAGRAKKAGFDAVQIHGAHGYLVNQFLSPLWNRRRDAYGGALENRARFLFDVYGDMREAVGSDYPILIKLTSEDFIEGGFTLDEAVWVAKALAAMGIDGIEVSGGSRYADPSHWHIRTKIARARQEAYFADNAQRIRREAAVPIIVVGGIRSWEVAEALVESGKADYIALSRPLICEPHLVNRWRSGDRSRSRCVSDNQCLKPGYEGRPVACRLQPGESAGGTES